VCLLGNWTDLDETSQMNGVSENINPGIGFGVPA